MRIFNTIMAALLMIGAILHGYGTLTLLPAFSDTWVWSLGSVLAAGLIAALNYLRPARKTDRALVITVAVASLLWAFVAVGFGIAIGHLGDPRVVWHGLCGLILAGLSFNDLRQA